MREQKELASGIQDGVRLTGLAAVAAEQKRSEAPIPRPQANPLIRGDADAHMLHALQAIKTPELDEALLTLPFDYACRLLPYLNRAIASGGAGVAGATELCIHTLLFLLSAHHKQLVSNQIMIDTLRDSRDGVRRALAGLKGALGFNMAALQFLERQAREQTEMFRFGGAEAEAAALTTAPTGAVSGSVGVPQPQPKKRKF